VYRTGTPEILVEQEHSHTAPPVYWSYSVWAILGAEEHPVGVVIQVTDATEMAIFRGQGIAMNEQLLLSAGPGNMNSRKSPREQTGSKMNFSPRSRMNCARR